MCCVLIPQDFSVEIEAMSVQRASVSREATKLLHLRDADCPGLRAQLAQLEGRWTQLTSDLSTVQDHLQQVHIQRVVTCTGEQLGFKKMHSVTVVCLWYIYILP